MGFWGIVRRVRKLWLFFNVNVNVHNTIYFLDTNGKASILNLTSGTLTKESMVPAHMVDMALVLRDLFVGCWTDTTLGKFVYTLGIWITANLKLFYWVFSHVKLTSASLEFEIFKIVKKLKLFFTNLNTVKLFWFYKKCWLNCVVTELSYIILFPFYAFVLKLNYDKLLYKI